jgi:serine/threonine protein kinase
MSSPNQNDDDEFPAIRLNKEDVQRGLSCSESSGEDPVTIGRGSSPQADVGAPIERRINTRGFKYRVEQLLGSGGFAEVFSAYDRSLRRYVAFKISKRAYANRDGRKQFLSEARTIAKLEHPHILPIYDIGLTDKGEAFVVTKLIATGDLSRAMTLKNLTRCEMVDITAAIAEALYHAHKNSVIHRDVKPANILIDENKHPYLTDFGLALREDSKVVGNEIAGTIPYMSPEQARGDVYRLDPRTDIYSLAVVLYEMLTGKRPFTASNQIDLIKNILQGEAKPPRQYDDTIPEELERIVLKALANRISDRYPTAMDFAKELRSFQSRITEVVAQASSVDIDNTRLDIFDSDIVISFAQVDDQPVSNLRPGWISNFSKNVALRVEQLMGESVRIITLPSKLDGQNLDTIVDSFDSVKTLVSILSPTFAKARDCKKIVERFADVIAKNQQHSRLIKVVKTPVEPKEIPNELQAIFSKVQEFAFFEQDGVNGRIRELDETLNDASALKYFERIYDVSDAIYRALKESRRDKDQPLQRSTPAGHVVYLAETTTDLAADREVLARELMAMGCTVLPRGILPRTVNEVEAQVAEDLAAASLCVHSFGSLYGLIPEGAQESVVAIQYRIAAVSNIPQVIWIPRDRPIRDQKQEAWIRTITLDPMQSASLEIIEDRITAVKEMLIQRVQENRVSRKIQETVLDSPPRLYMICDRVDEESTAELEDFFYSQGIEVLMPAFDRDEAEAQLVHISNLTACDGALVYYGATSRHWVDSHARELIKATGYRNSKPIAARLIYMAFPIDRRKERFKSLTTEMVCQSQDGDYPELKPFVELVKESSKSLRLSRIMK